MMVYGTQINKKSAEILLVEDNHGDIVLVTRAFNDLEKNVNLHAASSAEEALSMLRKEGTYATHTTPDLVLLDLNLPGMNGQELLAIIKEDPALKHIPVVILSSSHADHDVARSYELHASGHVVKPLAFEKFKEFAGTIENFFFKLLTLPEATRSESRGPESAGAGRAA